jgi:radical SAM superfamily enzyme YgiQ (UPF0313 family)
LLYPTYSYPRKNQPIGLAYLAGYLRDAGYKMTIIDFNVTHLSTNEINDILTSRKWLLIGISFMTNQFNEAEKLISLIAKTVPTIPLVGGGVHLSSIPERSFKELPGIDVIAKGEGEQTLLELANLYSSITNPTSQDFLNINGIFIERNGKVLQSPPRENLSDIDAIPFPAWEFFEPEKYNIFGIHEAENNAPMFLLFSSRGCPFACTFCDSQTVFSRSFRGRSASNIVEEMIYLHEKYGAMTFDFADDLFTTKKSRVYEICDEIDKTGIPFQWMVNARVDTVDREMLIRMKQSGCVRLDFGVESGDEKVRGIMGKKITDQQVIDAHKICTDVGLHTGSFCMVGNLGETKDSVYKTAELMRDIADDVMVSIAIPYPGTDMYVSAKEKGLINTEDWSKYATAPTYTKNYKPVMRNENLNEDEIVDAYFYLQSIFARRKFRERFGSNYLFRSKFLSEMIFKKEGFMRRAGMFAKLIMARIKLA